MLLLAAECGWVGQCVITLRGECVHGARVADNQVWFGSTTNESSDPISTRQARNLSPPAQKSRDLPVYNMFCLQGFNAVSPTLMLAHRWSAAQCTVNYVTANAMQYEITDKRHVPALCGPECKQPNCNALYQLCEIPRVKNNKLRLQQPPRAPSWCLLFHSCFSCFPDIWSIYDGHFAHCASGSRGEGSYNNKLSAAAAHKLRLIDGATAPSRHSSGRASNSCKVRVFSQNRYRSKAPPLLGPISCFPRSFVTSTKAGNFNQVGTFPSTHSSLRILQVKQKIPLVVLEILLRFPQAGTTKGAAAIVNKIIDVIISYDVAAALLKNENNCAVLPPPDDLMSGSRPRHAARHHRPAVHHLPASDQLPGQVEKGYQLPEDDDGLEPPHDGAPGVAALQGPRLRHRGEPGPGRQRRQRGDQALRQRGGVHRLPGGRYSEPVPAAVLPSLPAAARRPPPRPRRKGVNTDVTVTKAQVKEGWPPTNAARRIVPANPTVSKHERPTNAESADKIDYSNSVPTRKRVTTRCIILIFILYLYMSDHSSSHGYCSVVVAVVVAVAQFALHNPLLSGVSLLVSPAPSAAGSGSPGAGGRAPLTSPVTPPPANRHHTEELAVSLLFCFVIMIHCTCV